MKGLGLRQDSLQVRLTRPRSASRWGRTHVSRAAIVEPASTRVEDTPTTHEQDASKCPVLSALRPLPPPRFGFLEGYIQNKINPYKEQELSLGGRTVANGRFAGVLPMVLVGDVAAARELINQEASGAVVQGWPPATRLLLGKEAVVTAHGDHHKHLRKLLAPALSPEAIETYLPDIHATVLKTLDECVARCAANRTVPFAKTVKTMTLKIITSVTMGRSLTDEEVPEVSKDFSIWVSSLFDPMPIDRWPFPFHASMRARERLIEFAKGRVAEARAALASGSSVVATNTLATLLTTTDEEGRKLTDEQVLDNLFALLFAGHDTTSSQLTCLLSRLAQHPEVLDRVRAEQARVVQKHGPAMTPAALRDMQYTAAVLAESMRMTPVVGGAVRKTTTDIGVQGNLISKGKAVLFAIGYIMSKDPRWPEASLAESDPMHPSRFNPDRFMTAEGAKQGAQVPFGIGVHTCAGIALAQAEAKVFLAALARGYRFVADTNTKWSYAPIPQPKNGLPIFIERL